MCLALGLAAGGLSSALSFGVQALGAVAGFAAQSQQAAAQNEYYEENRRQAIKAQVNEYAHQQNKILQENRSASAEIFETKIEAMKARSTANAAAGEAGVTGLSVQALLNDYYGREGRRVDSLTQNYEMTRDNVRAEMDATQSKAIARINSVQRAAKPSFADAAVRILNAGVPRTNTGVIYQYG